MAKRLLLLGLFTMVAWVSQAQVSLNTVRYQITYNVTSGQYTVWVVPNYNTPNSNNSNANELGATAQVTLKVPSSFIIGTITDVFGIWEKQPLKLGPSEQSFFQNQGLDPNKAFYVIGKSASETNYGAFASGTPIPLFRFTGNGCLGVVEVIEKTDPFVAVSDQVLALNTAPSFYSRSGQPSGGNQVPLEQYIGTFGPGANCILAVNDTFSGIPGTPANQPVLTNDTFSGGVPTPSQVQVSILTPPSNGTTTINPDGTIRYTPNPGFQGTDTYQYQICDLSNLNVCSSATVSVNVACPVVATPTVSSPVIYCQDATAVALTATAQPGTSLRWYTVPTGGTFTTTAPIPPTNVATTLTYYVSNVSTQSGCESARVPIQVVVQPAPQAPAPVTPVVYCQNQVAVPLSATAPSGTTILWYTAATGGTGTFVAPTPNTATVGITTFFVSAVSTTTGCESLTRTPVQVTIQAPPAAPAANSPLSFCQNEIAPALTATPPSGSTLLWYTVPTGGSGSIAAPVPSTASVGTQTFYVASVHSLTGCESLTRTAIVVTVNATPTAPTATSPVVYCQGDVAVPLTATAPSGSVLRWYLVSSGGAVLANAPTPSTSVAGDFTFFVSSFSTVTGCESNRTPITVRVNAAPTAPVATSPVTYCLNDVATPLQATAPAGSVIRWYTQPTGGTFQTTAPTPSTAQNGTVTFYVTSFNTTTNCESLTRTPIQVIVGDRPTAPNVVSPVLYCEGEVAVALSATAPAGSSLRWYSSPTGGTPSTVAPIPSTAAAGSTLFYVSSVLNTSSCESATRSSIEVIVRQRPVAPSVTSPITLCQGVTATALTASAPAGSVVRWYTTPTGGTPLANAPVPNTSTPGTTLFYASSFNSTTGCESGTRTTVQVVVNGAPAAPTASNVTLCQGAPATPLTATAPVGTTLRWYTTSTGGTPLPSAPTPSTTALGQTTFFVSSVSTATNCESLTRTPLQVTVAVCRIIYAYNDNNVTPVNTPVSGNVLTNDDLNNGTGTLVVATSLVASPSNGTVSMAASGIYTYTPAPNFIGNDSFRYRVCDQGTPVVCDTALVVIHIHPQPRLNVNNPPIALNDNFTTSRNTPFTSTVLANDKDPDAGQTLTATLLTNTPSGSVTLNPNGTFTYTPAPNFVGETSFTYRTCDNGSPSLCDEAVVQIIIKDPTLDPQLPPVAADDYATTPGGVPVSGNVITNDRDPEGTPLVVSTTPVVTPTNGSVTLSQNGAFSYTPTPGFVGTDSFVYQVCDSGTPIECTKATVYVQVTIGSIRLQPRVYLQGALYNVFLPDTLMRDDLRVKGLLPLSSPYPALGMPEVTSTGPTTAGVLSVTGRNAIVDWVYVELRDQANPQQVLDSRSALLQRDGDIVDVDGVSPVTFTSTQPNSYFVAIKHRNHLGVMSRTALPLTSATTLVDFRKVATPTFRLTQTVVDQAQVVVQQGVAMWAGNVLRDGRVVYQGTGNDVNSVYQAIITPAANTLLSPFFKNRSYNLGDVNLNGETVFQGTGNDVEFIYLNVFGNHPGNVLGQNFFIIREQLP